MKYQGKLFFVLACGFFLNGIVNVVETSAETQKITDKLTICVEESELTETSLLPVVEKFRKMFPDVELEIQSLPGVALMTSEYTSVREAAVNQIRTEVMSGGGPDLFLLDVGKSNNTLDTENLFEDLEKNARAGVFCDLKELIEADGSLSLEDFYPFVEDAGTIGDSMVVFPTSFWGYTAITTEENATAIGLNVENAESSMDAFHEELMDCLTEEQRVAIGLTYYSGLSYPLLDYDTGEIRLGENEKKYFEWTKESDQIFNKWVEKGYTSLEEAQLILDRSFPVIGGIASTQSGAASTTQSMAALGGEAIFLLFPDEEGDGVAFISSYAAINSNSQNKQAALEFLKILLSEEMQMQGYYPGTDSFPVRKGTDILTSVLNIELEEKKKEDPDLEIAQLSEKSIESLAQVLERMTVGRLQQLFIIPINGEMTFEDYYGQYVADEITYEEFTDIVSEGMMFYWEE